MAIPPPFNRPHETLLAKLNRLFDEWSTYILIMMFGLTCFLLGAAWAKWHLSL